MKEVKKQVRKEVKRIFLLDLLNAVRSGEILSRWAKKRNISRQKLYYYTTKLKKKGLIEKIGYGVWKETKRCKNSTKDPIDLKEVRGHAFIWRVKIPQEIKGWENRIKILEKLNIPYKLVGIKETPRIIINKRKIWLANKQIIVYEPHSFFSTDSIESRKLAVFGLTNTLEMLEKRLRIDLKPYNFTVNREHYALIKNHLAIQCNKEGEKILVYDAGGLWFLIDNSYNLDEAETLGKRALENNLGVQRYFNSHKETGFKVTPEFILNTMNGIQQNQLQFAENMKSHIEAIQELGKGVKELRKEIKRGKDDPDN